MNFSPAIMATLPVREFKLKGQKAPYKAFHWKGSYSAFVALTRDCMADESPAGRDLRGRMGESFRDSWSGIPESFDQWKDTGNFQTAVDAFNKAEAKLEATRFQPDALRPAVAGGAWVIPLVLASNPMPARIRPRSKLPPKNIDLTISVSWMVGHEDISRAMAAVARASWDYLQAGGAVTLTAHYAYGFNERNGEARGVVFSVQIPLTSVSAFASSASAQQFRGAPIRLAQSLSGLKGDSLPVLRVDWAGALDITGNVADDDKARELFAIKPAA